MVVAAISTLPSRVRSRHAGRRSSISLVRYNEDLEAFAGEFTHIADSTPDNAIVAVCNLHMAFQYDIMAVISAQERAQVRYWQSLQPKAPLWFFNIANVARVNGHPLPQDFTADRKSLVWAKVEEASSIALCEVLHAGPDTQWLEDDPQDISCLIRVPTPVAVLIAHGGWTRICVPSPAAARPLGASSNFQEELDDEVWNHFEDSVILPAGMGAVLDQPQFEMSMATDLADYLRQLLMRVAVLARLLLVMLGFGCNKIELAWYCSFSKYV